MPYKVKRGAFTLLVMILVSFMVFSFVSCGSRSAPQGGNTATTTGGGKDTSTTATSSRSTGGGEETSTSANVTGSTTVANVLCPPDKGLVIFGTEGCPHCRALKTRSYGVFGENNTCFVEVSPAYGGTEKARDFFPKIYKEAYPFIKDSDMGVPLAFLFYGGEVRGVFIGEMPTETLSSMEKFVSTSTQSFIVWGGKAYVLTATAQSALTQDIKNFFKNR